MSTVDHDAIRRTLAGIELTHGLGTDAHHACSIDNAAGELGGATVSAAPTSPWCAPTQGVEPAQAQRCTTRSCPQPTGRTRSKQPCGRRRLSAAGERGRDRNCGPNFIFGRGSAQQKRCEVASAWFERGIPRKDGAATFSHTPARATAQAHFPLLPWSGARQRSARHRSPGRDPFTQRRALAPANARGPRNFVLYRPGISKWLLPDDVASDLRRSLLAAADAAEGGR